MLTGTLQATSARIRHVILLSEESNVLENITEDGSGEKERTDEFNLNSRYLPLQLLDRLAHESDASVPFSPTRKQKRIGSIVRSPINY